MIEIKKLNDHTYELSDADKDSFYLVIGSRKAAVIDTGISKGERILPQLKALTTLPMVLVLTHAHIDHFHHMDEFETVYMSHKELSMPRGFLEAMMEGKTLDLEGTINVTTGDKLDLGGQTLEICEVPGHTPGSICVYNPEQNQVFTGDAIGSGCGVWMQLLGCSTLSEYQQSLQHFLAWLVERGGRMQFRGGHSHQSAPSIMHPQGNPLSLGLLCDMIDLVEQVRSGYVAGKPCHGLALTQEPSLLAAYGRADLVYRQGIVD